MRVPGVGDKVLNLALRDSSVLVQDGFTCWVRMPGAALFCLDLPAIQVAACAVMDVTLYPVIACIAALDWDVGM